MSWQDNSINETHFTIQRATNVNGPWTNVATVPSTTGPATGGAQNYVDTSAVKGTQYQYRVVASNIVGDTTVYTAPAVGFPSLSVNSPPSASVAGSW